MPFASEIKTETQPDGSDLCTLDGVRYWRDRVGCLKPVRTEVLLTSSTNTLWNWLIERAAGGLSIQFQLKAFGAGFWLFALTDAALEKARAKFPDEFAAELVPA